ncbi:MAG: hypothetical protein WBQ23_12050 [Bacteroidota bacterium]
MRKVERCMGNGAEQRMDGDSIGESDSRNCTRSDCNILAFVREKKSILFFRKSFANFVSIRLSFFTFLDNEATYPAGRAYRPGMISSHLLHLPATKIFSLLCFRDAGEKAVISEFAYPGEKVRS